MVLDLKRLITKKIGNVAVSYTPESRRLLVEHAKRARESDRLAGKKGGYSFIQDLLRHSSRERLVDRGGRKTRVTKSDAVSTVRGAISKGSHSVHRDPDSGAMRRKYWFKDIRTEAGTIPVFVKDMREQASFALKNREAEDAIEQSKRVGLNVPELMLKVEMPKRKGSSSRRLISVTKKIEGAIPADTFWNSKATNREKQETLQEIRDICNRLAEEDLLPTFLRSGQILVSETRPRRIFFADTGSGFQALTRNRVFLLEELRARPKLRRPDWDVVHNDSVALERYFMSLPKDVRMSVYRRKIDHLIRDIKSGEKEGLSFLRNRQRELIARLFPESKVAKSFRKK